MSSFTSPDNIIQTKTHDKQNGETHLTICTEPLLLLPILEGRLPHSCFMYNQLKTFDDFKDDLQVYTLNEDFSDGYADASNLWIFFKFCREDWDPCISISSPSPSSPTLLPPSVQYALENGGILNWFGRFVFIAVDRNIADFIVKLNIHKFGNIITAFPVHLFCMDPDEALKLEVNSGPSVEVRRMEPAEGTRFITTNWPHTQDGTEAFVRKSLEKHVSAGVFVSGELVCGALVPGYGLISCLLTLPEHRRKGYASLVIKAMYKELAARGFQPCLCGGISDQVSAAFHSSIANRIISQLYYIGHKHNAF